MSKTDPIIYSFHGKKDADGRVLEHHPGIPARGLTQADVDRAERRGLLDTIEASPLYRPVKRADPDAPAAKAGKSAAPATAGQEG